MKSSSHAETPKHTAYKISVITITVNLILSIYKLTAGIISHSSAMISDAIHSASDVLSTFIVIIGIKISSKTPDKEHPYGHERFECISALILSMLLFVTGIGIGWSGIRNIISGNDSLNIPGVGALIAAVISIAVKEAMYHYTIRGALKINSGALKADAWHHRSDALSSVGSLVGIEGARLGFKILDPIASVIICVFIAKASFDIFSDAAGKMTDHSCDKKTIDEIKKNALSQKGVLSIDLLKTRMFGNKIYVDIEIGVDKDLSLEKAHEIAEKTHDAIESWSGDIKHCMVHVNPFYIQSKSETEESHIANENDSSK